MDEGEIAKQRGQLDVLHDNLKAVRKINHRVDNTVTESFIRLGLFFGGRVVGVPCVMTLFCTTRDTLLWCDGGVHSMFPLRRVNDSRLRLPPRSKRQRKKQKKMQKKQRSKRKARCDFATDPQMVPTRQRLSRS